MKIEFTVSNCKADRYHYECTEFGDMSGSYYPESEVVALKIELEKWRKRARARVDRITGSTLLGGSTGLNEN